MGANRVSIDAQCYRTDQVVKNFKVYPNYEKVKMEVSRVISITDSLVPARRISVPLKKGALRTTASNSEGGLKFAQKIKGKSVSSAKQHFNFRRKALADVTNTQGNLLGNVTCDCSKPK